MSPKQWIQRWLKENKQRAADLARASGVGANKISDILNDKNSGTPTYMVPLSIAMDISLDSIYDEKATWPGKRLSEQGEFLSPAEKEVLRLARYWSDGDESLTPAIDRMNGKPSAFLPAARSPRGDLDERNVAPDVPDSVGAKKRAGHAGRNGKRSG